MIPSGDAGAAIDVGKLVEAQVSVEANGHGPARFWWRQRWVKVDRVVEEWTDAGAWWDGEREKTFYRVLSARGGVYELYREEPGRWVLYKVYD